MTLLEALRDPNLFGRTSRAKAGRRGASSSQRSSLSRPRATTSQSIARAPGRKAWPHGAFHRSGADRRAARRQVANPGADRRLSWLPCATMGPFSRPARSRRSRCWRPTGARRGRSSVSSLASSRPYRSCADDLEERHRADRPHQPRRHRNQHGELSIDARLQLRRRSRRRSRLLAQRRDERQPGYRDPACAEARAGLDSRALCS